MPSFFLFRHNEDHLYQQDNYNLSYFGKGLDLNPGPEMWKACVLTYVKNVPSLYPSLRGHGGRVVTLLPPTSVAGVRFPAWPQVGKLVVACLLVGSLQYRTLTNCMYWFPLPFQLPVVI